MTINIHNIRCGDHVLVRAKVTLPVHPSEDHVAVMVDYQILSVTTKDIVTHEPNFAVGEYVQSEELEACGEILKLRGDTAVVLWEHGPVSSNYPLTKLAIAPAKEF